MRTCVGCRGRFPQAALVRFVRAASGAWGVDVVPRGPGRGAYLCSRACAARSLKNKRYPGLGLVARAVGLPETAAAPHAAHRDGLSDSEVAVYDG